MSSSALSNQAGGPASSPSPSTTQLSTILSSTISSSVSVPPAAPQISSASGVASICTPGWINGTEVICPTSTASTSTVLIDKATSTLSFVTSQPSANGSTASGRPTASVGPLPAQKGLSGGAVAGVAIAMLLVGLLIAGAIFFFLLRRQKKKRYNLVQTQPSPHAPVNDATRTLEKGPTAVTSAYATNINDMLPQPVADDTITDAVLKLRDNIKNHVRTYYHLSPIPAASVSQAHMGQLATATGTSSTRLASMLSNTSTRAETLRLILAWIVLSRCTGGRDESLLPRELAAIDMVIPGKDGSNTAQSAMYSKWKTVTGTLLHERISQNKQDSDRKQKFAIAVADLDSIVAPFVQSGLEAQRSKNLDMILTRSANLAFLLFSQPGSFKFEFLSEHGGLVVFPGLVQTIGDQGQVLGPPRVLLEKEIAT
ncbi:hypothetical protein AA0113_g11301 [Alternaria arborescens]|uniref:Uncharacterized protein n=1 Tax=Alternaria arborescens TaxID=156630 RepID=A0A4Q4QB16_9PLEO|nr:hypothetical protein AA0112_g12305 [Alternaria arborescens]RYO38087.1 hypothetical protein AA0113_g11301 [Alternaria arborescens]